MRDVTRRILELGGWNVIEAENGRVGLERLAAFRPGVILLDLMMPEMDGFEFVDELRRHPEWKSIPVVVVTAKDLTAEDRDALEWASRPDSAKRAPTRAMSCCAKQAPWSPAV